METIRLIGAENKKGPVIPRKIYDDLVECILTCIKATESQTVSFYDLLEHVRVKLAAQRFPGDLAWYLLQVKVDLQQKGILKTSLENRLNQLIHINQDYKPGSWNAAAATRRVSGW